MPIDKELLEDKPGNSPDEIMADIRSRPEYQLSFEERFGTTIGETQMNQEQKDQVKYLFDRVRLTTDAYEQQLRLGSAMRSFISS